LLGWCRSITLVVDLSSEWCHWTLLGFSSISLLRYNLCIWSWIAENVQYSTFPSNRALRGLKYTHYSALYWTVLLVTSRWLTFWEWMKNNLQHSLQALPGCIDTKAHHALHEPPSIKLAYSRLPRGETPLRSDPSFRAPTWDSPRRFRSSVILVMTELKGHLVGSADSCDCSCRF